MGMSSDSIVDLYAASDSHLHLARMSQLGTIGRNVSRDAWWLSDRYQPGMTMYMERTKDILQAAREGYRALQSPVVSGRDIAKANLLCDLDSARLGTLGTHNIFGTPEGDIPGTAREIDEILPLIEKAERGEATVEEARRAGSWLYHVGVGALKGLNGLSE